MPSYFVDRTLARLYRLYCSTLSVRALLPDGSAIPPQPYCFDDVIFAHCERDTLALSSVLPRRRFVLLVATGRDGNRATTALLRTGSRVVRGSSLRGGARALLQLIRLLRSSSLPAALSVDG